MKNESPELSRQEEAFTLIELLVVIAIIGILAGMLLPALSLAKTHAKEAVAQTTMANLTASISLYQSDYSSSLPASQAALNAASALSNPLNPSGPPGADFTFGTLIHVTTPPLPTLNNVSIVGGNVISPNAQTVGSSYQNCNSEVISILTDAAYYPENSVGRHTYNSQQTSLFTSRSASDTNSPGIDVYNILRDPWGLPYVITLDLNGDNKCVDNIWAQTLYWANAGNTNFSVPGSSMIWSFGYLKHIDLTGLPNSSINKHVLKSWQ